MTVQVLLAIAAALVTKTSNTRLAIAWLAMLTDCAGMGATLPVHFDTCRVRALPDTGTAMPGRLFVPWKQQISS